MIGFLEIFIIKLVEMAGTKFNAYPIDFKYNFLAQLKKGTKKGTFKKIDLLDIAHCTLFHKLSHYFIF